MKFVDLNIIVLLIFIYCGIFPLRAKTKYSCIKQQRQQHKQQQHFLVRCWFRKNDWLNACLAGFMNACDCMHGWLNASLIGYILHVTGCMIDWMHGWLDAWMHGWLDACLNGCIPAWLTACMIDWMHVRLSDCIHAFDTQFFILLCVRFWQQH